MAMQDTGAAVQEFSMGQILRQARESKKLSLAEVSKATKISLNVLGALEAEDFSKLPSGVYAKVFFKTYANYLGVGAQVLEQCEKIFSRAGMPAVPMAKPEMPLTTAVVSQDRFAAKLGTRSRFLKLNRVMSPISLGFLGLVLLVLLIWGLWPESAEISPKEQPVISTQNIAAVPPSPVLPAVVPAKPAPQEIARDGLYLEILALDKVWLRVKADNLLLFEGTLAKNEKESWKSQREFLVRIGSAGAVNVFLNDRDLGWIGKKGEVKTVVINKEGIVKTR